ncbi:MAG: metalloregulator ArsR/SmtB family transcription factor [Chloroflexi bacterium]|nr:metalloregulator ArsR/SmtB family transcription factor [Chloroflexota bacterium]
MESALNITKALADGNRLRVIAALMEQKELCVCQITEMLQLATATVSRHLRVLQNARLVQNRKDERWVYYRLADSFPEFLRQWISESMLETMEIETDRNNLKIILSCEPDDLCRNQKEKRI